MIKNIRSHLQKHKDFRALMREGVQGINDADPRPVALLLGSLQFAGGWYLFVPFARFLPPFNKLFEALPPWVWAVYFVLSGIAAMVSSLLPDGARYLCARFSISVWMFFNWFFLTVTSLMTAMWILNDGKGSFSYGIGLAFFPCLSAASVWTARRMRQILADETSEEFAQEHHVRDLRNAAIKRSARLKKNAEPLEF